MILVTGGHWWLAVLHAGLIALAAWTNKGGDDRFRRVTGDLLPLIVAPLLYGELPLLIAAVGTTYHDPTIQGWELRLFGTQPSRTLAARFPFMSVSELLHGGYLGYYLVIFIPPLVLLARGERRGFGETVLALTIAYTVCWSVFIAFPVEGPRYLWGAPAGIPNGPMRRLAAGILAAGSSRGAAFPSSHMAISVTQAMMAWRWQRKVGWVLWLVTFLVGFGAVYGGFHYAVDILAGAALGAVVASSVIATSNH